MVARLSQVRWDLVAIAAVLIYIVTFVLGVALSLPLLAFLNWTGLDPDSASLASALISALVVILVTGFGAMWVARRVERAALLHGFLVGLAVALLSLALDVLFRPLTPVGLLLYTVMVAAGLLGGMLGRRRRELP
jgi:putative membrane protein (TIGR04086 family)